MGGASVQSPETLLLMGPPNVGKSALFNHLTGLNVSVANYVGTTVEYTEGPMRLPGRDAVLIDVPGTYTLEATNDAEQVAVEMLRQKPAAVICVVDAVNFESSLYLLLQVLEYGLPTLVVVNRWDLAQQKGYRLDFAGLARELGVPLVPAIAVAGQGIPEIMEEAARLVKAKPTPHPVTVPEDQRWRHVEQLNIRFRRQIDTKEHPMTKWGVLLVKPWPGLPIAVLALVLVFAFVIGFGMGMRRFFLLPAFRGVVMPFIETVVQAVVPPGMMQRILIGEYGFLIKGIEWPFTLVLPYVASFYFVLSFLEDSGYLPRLAVLVDGLMQRIGLQGGSIIPLLLGYGCGIPGILATRALNSHKERVIVSVLICIAVPCISQTGAFISLLAAHSIAALLAVFSVSVLAMFLAGLIMDRMLSAPMPLTMMEVPELLMPRPEVLWKKIFMRLRSYVSNGAVPMIIAVGVASVLYETGLMAAWGRLLGPVVTGWLRLPEEAAVPLALGILRRELTVLPLLEMDITTLQLFTGALVALFYVPCIAMIGTISREYGVKLGMGILVGTTVLALFVGGLAAQIGHFFGL